MALIQCPECDGNLSGKAHACPHCGYPREGTERNDSHLEEAEDICRQIVEGNRLAAELSQRDEEAERENDEDSTVFTIIMILVMLGMIAAALWLVSRGGIL